MTYLKNKFKVFSLSLLSFIVHSCYWLRTRLKWAITGRRTITIIGCDIACKTAPPYEYSTDNVLFFKDGTKHIYENCKFRNADRMVTITSTAGKEASK